MPNGYQGPDLAWNSGSGLSGALDPVSGRETRGSTPASCRRERRHCPGSRPDVALTGAPSDGSTGANPRHDQDAVAGAAYGFRVDLLSPTTGKNWSNSRNVTRPLPPSLRNQSGHSGGLGPQPVVDPPRRDGADGEPWLRRFAQGIIKPAEALTTD